jgi:hypothetical protein
MENNYLGNPNLKRANVPVEWTEEQVKEYAKCMENPLYFIQEYVKIISLDEGLVPFKMYNFQKEMVGTFHSNRFTICKLPRQSGKSTTIIAYLLHYVLFNPFSQCSNTLQTRLQLQKNFQEVLNLYTNFLQNCV